jgi:hypothetical protein
VSIVFLHITEAGYTKSYEVEVAFNNGRRGVADLSEALTGPVFEPLRNLRLFAQLRVDEELETIVWPNGADLAPEYLYFLAFRQEPGLQQQFRDRGYLGSEARLDLAGRERPPGD